MNEPGTPTDVVERQLEPRLSAGGPHLQFAAGTGPNISPVPAAAPAAVQLAARDLAKTYYKGSCAIPVLRGVDLDVREGEFLSVVGQSGSGKSTLLHLLGTLDRPDAGTLHLGDRRIDNVSARQRDRLRNRYFGMVFQFYHLLPELSALGNVLAPLMIGNGLLTYLAHRAAYRRRAEELLELVGLGHRLKHKPRELSGGEMQRTAIARALITDPKLLLADEPTGNLDRKTGGEIMDILRTLNHRQKLTIVMVTHDDGLAAEAHRTVRLVEGRLVESQESRVESRAVRMAADKNR